MAALSAGHSRPRRSKLSASSTQASTTRIRDDVRGPSLGAEEGKLPEDHARREGGQAAPARCRPAAPRTPTACHR